MQEDDAEPDGLAILFMSHFLGKNITLISGKGDEWKAEDIADNIILVYRGDNQYCPTDVGTYHLYHCLFFIIFFKCCKY